MNENETNVEVKTESVKKTNRFKKDLTSKMVKIALLSTLSFVLFIISFSLPIFPSFLELQFSNFPAILGGFILGPVGGCAIILVRTILKLIFIPTTSAYVGELSDFIIGIAVILVTSLIYKHHKTRKNGYVSLGFGVLTWVVVSALSNWLLIAPFYINVALENGVADFVKFLSIIPGVTEANVMSKYIFYAVIPFNLTLSLLVTIVTAISYKKLSHLFKKF